MLLLLIIDTLILVQYLWVKLKPNVLVKRNMDYKGKEPLLKVEHQKELLSSLARNNGQICLMTNTLAYFTNCRKTFYDDF
jgi:hypothetical protein